VKECLDTNWVSSAGAFVDRFEKSVADYVGTGHAVATVNGTAALHVALLVADVRPEDEVIVSALSFIAPANAVRYVGAWPVFVDSDPDSWQMDTQKLAGFLESDCQWVDGELRNSATGRRVSAILPVHILGHPVDMDPLLDVARKFSLTVIEDATESLGTKYKQKNVGSLGHVACFSFNGNKLITTGGGGMIVTDNAEWAEKARYLTTQAKDNPVEYVHREVGYNYRLTNVQAAIGCAQLERVDEHVSAKRRIAEDYSEALGSVPGITVMREADWAASVFWMYTILVDANQFGTSSRELMRELAEKGIETRPLWQPLHVSPAHRDCQCVGGGAVAERLNRDGLSLPCSVGLTVAEQKRVIDGVESQSKGRARLRTPDR